MEGGDGVAEEELSDHLLMLDQYSPLTGALREVSARLKV